MLLMNRAGVTKLSRYWPIAFALWAFMLASGVHATIAGVLAALTIPMRNAAGGSPLEAAEHTLKPWVQFVIMPIFALANAGVHLGDGFADLTHPIALACAAGLLLGKPLGIASAAFVASWALKTPLPCRPLNMLGVSMIAGVGFTMSLFIGTLAFGAGDLAAPLRLGVLAGSILSALAGLAMLSWSLSRGAPDAGDPNLARDEETAQRDGVIGG
jgi:NhaA family Na+:H+ antiporter